jgi:hypothetical protein
MPNPMLKKIGNSVYRIIKKPLILALLVLAVLWLLQRTSIFPAFSNLFRHKPLLIENTPLVVTQIKQIAELHTVQMYAEVVVDSSYLNDFGVTNRALRSVGMPTVPVDEYNTLVIIAKGKVRAGINLAALADSNVVVTKDSVAITLPAAQIFDVVINPADFETFIETGTWTPQATQLVKAKAKAQLLALAQQQNLLAQARQKALAVLQQFLTTAGFRAVSFSFTR